MLNHEDIIRVENRDNTLVGYRIPELNIQRRFEAYETKEITMRELRSLSASKGGRNVIKNHLIIHSQEAVQELIPDVEPEYFYTTKDVEFLLLRGSLDQLLDALDFAPEGVVALIQEEAVRLRINDLSKRDAIFEKTQFNVTKAIEIQQIANENKQTTEVRTRRAAPIGQTIEEELPEESAPVRRTAQPKFKINVNN